MLGIFLDTETNGLNAQKHKVIEVAFEIIDVLTGEKKASFESIVSLSKEDWAMSDSMSLKVNGFTWEELEKGKSSKRVAEEISQLFKELSIKRGGAVFICQNPSFDRAFFAQLIDPETQEKRSWPYHWLDLASMHWGKAIQEGASGKGNFPWETGYSKDKIATYYSLPKEISPHRAMNGVKHLILCYQAVVGFPKI